MSGEVRILLFKKCSPCFLCRFLRRGCASILVEVCLYSHHQLGVEAAAVVLSRTRLSSISPALEVLVFTLLYICLSTLQSDLCEWWSKNFTFWKMFTMLFMQVLEEGMCISSGRGLPFCRVISRFDLKDYNIQARTCAGLMHIRMCPSFSSTNLLLPLFLLVM